MRGITKRFSNVVANDEVTFCVSQGEIHSLLGENGAGKSTLMKVLFGLYKQDEGEIIIDGRRVDIRSPRDAYHLGIGMVHQHFMLVNNMSVLENIILGNEQGNVVIDKQKNREIVQRLSALYNFEVDLDAKISSLSVGMKQRVEILKTLYRGAEMIIFDEPTAVLTPLESSQLLAMLTDMKKQGKTIVFITHKLGETMAVSDKVTVLRGGKLVGTLDTASTTPEELARLMVGREITFDIDKKTKQTGEVVLSVQGVKLMPNSQSTCSFDIRAGEVFGVAGVDGNGQQELEEVVMGLTGCKTGRILLNGKEISSMSVAARRKLKIGYIPSDRFKQAILPRYNLTDNYLLGNQFSDDFVKRGIVSHKFLKKRAGEQMKGFDVRFADDGQSMNSLSGGNQQKFVLSREVGKNPALIVACQPVRGLDINAIQFVRNTLLELRERNKAILLISAELSDLFQLSDRIGVLYKGDLMAVRPAEQYTNESISLLMAGREAGDADETDR